MNNINRDSSNDNVIFLHGKTAMVGKNFFEGIKKIPFQKKKLFEYDVWSYHGLNFFTPRHPHDCGDQFKVNAYLRVIEVGGFVNGELMFIPMDTRGRGEVFLDFFELNSIHSVVNNFSAHHEIIAWNWKGDSTLMCFVCCRYNECVQIMDNMLIFVVDNTGTVNLLRHVGRDMEYAWKKASRS